MANSGLMWECSCGNVVYGEEEPEECGKCGRLNNFIKMPGEIVEERMKEEVSEEQEVPKKEKTAKKTKKARRKK